MKVFIYFSYFILDTSTTISSTTSGTTGPTFTIIVTGIQYSDTVIQGEVNYYEWYPQIEQRTTGYLIEIFKKNPTDLVDLFIGLGRLPSSSSNDGFDSSENPLKVSVSINSILTMNGSPVIIGVEGATTRRLSSTSSYLLQITELWKPLAPYHPKILQANSLLLSARQFDPCPTGY